MEIPRPAIKHGALGLIRTNKLCFRQRRIRLWRTLNPRSITYVLIKKVTVDFFE